MFTTLSIRTMDWVRNTRDGVSSHRLRTRIFLGIYDPAGSMRAYIYMIFMCCLSMTHVAVWVMQESDAHGSSWGGREVRSLVFFVINSTLATIFGSEIVCCFLVHPSLRRLLKDGHMWIDVLSMCPLCARVYLGPSPDAGDNWEDAGRTIFRLVEALTALRLLRLARHFHGGILLWTALERSLSALFVPIYMLAVLVMFCNARPPVPTLARSHAFICRAARVPERPASPSL